MKRSNPVCQLMIILSFAVACQKESEQKVTPKFIETAYMDSTVSPGDDFFLFVNGKWLKDATVPDTESEVGAILELYNRTKQNLHLILEETAKGNFAPGSIEQKVGDYYASGMDSLTIEKRGAEPLKPYLNKIASLTDTKSIMQYDAASELDGLDYFMGAYVAADEKNSTMNILNFRQAGLGLPDRDYYFMTDANTSNVQQAYKKYMRNVFVLTGDDSVTAAKKTDAVYALEKQLAASHRTNVELRNPQINYNKRAVADLDKKMPAIGWSSFIKAIHVTADSVNIGQPAYFEKLNGLLVSTPVGTWKDYFRFHTVFQLSPSLSHDFVRARFDYVGRALNGQQKMKSRWERIYVYTDNDLGEALGQLYVKKHFNEDAKRRMMELITNLDKAFEARIGRLDWMSAATKETARAKLHTFLKKIGYPDTWKDYSNVPIDSSKYFENVIACDRDNIAFELSKVGKPVDKTEWGMTPPTINAYYNPTFNEIVFPAGILQFPLFDAQADDAINYGAIGMVIGHEMTHGFDDQGAQYDKDGNLKNWWAPEDETKFKEKAKQVIDLYNTFTVLDTLHVNGALTTGENIADIGGIAIAYEAFKMTPQGKATTRIDGFTPDQRFFIALAQAWRSKRKDEISIQYINIDPHSPPVHRVNGPLMNFTPFYEAFGVKEGDKMFKPENERIRIW